MQNTITATELASLAPSSFLLVDVRDEAAYSLGHIAGAIQISRDEIRAAVAEHGEHAASSALTFSGGRVLPRDRMLAWSVSGPRRCTEKKPPSNTRALLWAPRLPSVQAPHGRVPLGGRGGRGPEPQGRHSPNCFPSLLHTRLGGADLGPAAGSRGTPSPWGHLGQHPDAQSPRLSPHPEDQ